MKTIFPAAKLSIFFFVLLFGLTIQNAFSQSSAPLSNSDSPLPAPTAPVNDYAGVLDEATKSQLNQRIIQFRDQSNPKVELAVAVIKTTDGRDIFDYSTAVARGWGIGSKQTDNPGALLLVAIDDHKYFTQVSRDLEDELSDGTVGSLQRQYLVPAFKQGDYGKGISDTIDAYIKTIQAKQTGAPAPTPAQGTGRSNQGSLTGGGCCLIIVFIIMIIIFSRGGRGGRGGGGGLGSALPWIIGSAIANSGSSSGSSSWGGGGSSGGSDWGGFGGGGDFGGGGAGGSW